MGLLTLEPLSSKPGLTVLDPEYLKWNDVE